MEKLKIRLSLWIRRKVRDMAQVFIEMFDPLAALMKFVHMVCLTLAMVTVVAITVWPQSTLSERIMSNGQRLDYLSERVHNLEEVQTEKRLTRIETTMHDIQETGVLIKGLQVGQILGMLGLGAGQVVVGRKRRYVAGPGMDVGEEK